jgi:hypothetical protein
VLIIGALDTAVVAVTKALAPGPLNSSSGGANYPDLDNPLGLGIIVGVPVSSVPA